MLNEKQKKFVNEYMKTLNATQAALRAGYSKKTAKQQGSRLLTNVAVQKELAERMKNRAARAEIRQEDILRELAAIGFAKATDYVRIQGGRVIFANTDNLPEDDKKAIIEIADTQSGPRVKLGDKVKALELLGKHIGMFADRVLTAEVDPEVIKQVESVVLGDDTE